MDILGVIGFIILIVLVILIFSLLGWVGKGLGAILDLVGEGCRSSVGCFFWIFIILAIIIGLAGGFS